MLFRASYTAALYSLYIHISVAVGEILQWREGGREGGRRTDGSVFLGPSLRRRWDQEELLSEVTAAFQWGEKTQSWGLGKVTSSPLDVAHPNRPARIGAGSSGCSEQHP